MNLLSRFRTPTEERQGLVELYPTWSNLTEKTMGGNRNAYLASPTVLAAVSARQRVFSEVRFALRRSSNGDLVTSHPSLRVLERPWPGGTATELLKRLELDVSLSGTAFIYRPFPDQLQVLDPRKVEIQTDGYELSGYLYWPNGIGIGKPRGLLPSEATHWSPLPHPEHAYTGAAWVEAVIPEIRTEIKQIRHQEKFFDNSATPNLYVKVAGKMSPDSRDRLRQELENRYQGVANAWKTIVMDQDAELQTVGSTFEQMDYVNVQKSTEGRIASAAGTPPIILGLKAGLDASTYSNYGMAMRAFADHLIRPNWNSVVAALEPILTIPRGSELWFDDSGVAALRADKQEEAQIQATIASTINTYITAGYTPESAVQAAVNHDPTLLVHSGLVSVQLSTPGEDPEPEPDVEAEEDPEPAPAV